MISVATADALFQLETSKVSLALTWVLLALTVIFLREFIVATARDYRDAHKSQSKDTQRETH
jgi:hypothetical protein